MKKVAFIFDQVRHFHEDLFRQLESRLSAKGVELHLLRGSANLHDPRGDSGKKVVENEYRYQLRDLRAGSYTFRFSTGYLPIISQLAPQVIVCPTHPGNFGIWAVAARQKPKGAKLVSWHCGYEYNPSRVKDFVIKRFMALFDHHLAYHTNAKLYALKYGVPEARVTVTHNTINEGRIIRMNKSEARALVSEKFPVVAGKKILLHVGALLKEKRIEVLVDAMKILPDRDVVLLVVGGGPYMEDLQKYAAGSARVVFAGPVLDGVGCFFDAADVYLLPGTGGLGINEAMAHGLPVIAGYADGSADDLVLQNINGFRLESGTPEEVTGFLGKILLRPEIAGEMGAQSYSMITGKFAFSNFLDRIEQVLHNQLSGAD
jgi:glycosyltransferase involved in cell wall biosynthesis